MLELGGIVLFGIFAQWLAWKVHLPAILPLILFGLLLGPVYQAYYGVKLIDPTYDEVAKTGLFLGETLFGFVSLAIGIILFEGGLTLRFREVRNLGPTIFNLITIGTIATLVGVTLASMLMLGISFEISLMFASLIVVTGPTVIAPILRNVPLKSNIATILKWEGILIDPIGLWRHLSCLSSSSQTTTTP